MLHLNTKSKYYLVGFIALFFALFFLFSNINVETNPESIPVTLYFNNTNELIDRAEVTTLCLEGSLGVSLQQIGGILEASVDISTDKEPAFVTVTLKLDPGVQLLADQMDGIKHFVADSVKNASYNDVTIYKTN